MRPQLSVEVETTPLLYGSYDVVLGGGGNVTDGSYDVIVGGNNNAANGEFLVCLGGLSNQAYGSDNVTDHVDGPMSGRMSGLKAPKRLKNRNV